MEVALAELDIDRHLAARRVNRSWFDVRVDEVVAYIHGELDWSEIDFAHPAALEQYIIGARLVTGQASRQPPSPRAAACVPQ